MDNVKFSNFILHKFRTKIHISKRNKHMKQKVTREFSFHYPLTQKIVRNYRIVTERVGDLLVEGTAYFNPAVSPFDTENNRYDVDIDFVKWNDTDIKPVIEVSGMLDDITEAAIRYVPSLFLSQPANGLAA